MSTLEKVILSLQVSGPTSDRVAAAKQSASQISDPDLISISEFLIQTGRQVLEKNKESGDAGP
ncbi:hypothetical protein [Stieleria neptunia]|uniref:hypothetical protein n=1 Tax=Stieleria neptunia TaxID=2527979 RepID=UPI0011AA8AD6|nr:hypothetical protein [Stieleria neptunia]